MHLRLPTRFITSSLIVAAALASLAGCADDRPPVTPPVTGETGRMVGMTEAHNRLRALTDTPTPLPPLTWDTTLAADAQAWSEHLAATGCGLTHSTVDFGENLYWQSGGTVTPDSVVTSWYDEISCYTFGAFMDTDVCDMTCASAMNASGCGHYTQIVWRDTLRVGCGMATCTSGAEIWTCRYDPAGNWVGQPAY
jgi:hypothetical protein